MKYTFKLKEPNLAKETSILFSCFFKYENKKFIYSTGEKIHPSNWDTPNKFPFTNGKNKSKFAEGIKMQLNRYSDLMLETESQYKKINEPFTTKTLKKVFDEEFKKTRSGKNIFFDAFDEFVAEKKETMQWTEGTEKRYLNVKKILKKFEIEKKHTLTFSGIDSNFYNKFAPFVIYTLNQTNSTYLKNLSLFKTFVNWSIRKKYTYNNAFLNFNKDDNGNAIIKPTITRQIGLTIDDLNRAMKHEFTIEKLERSRDLFVLQCVTGVRYGELFTIQRSNVTDSFLCIKDQKDKTKPDKEIPLTAILLYILKKYDYDLPMITNQKQNEYIKEVFKELGYTDLTLKTTTQGKEIITKELFFYQRITTHTARRTFITMLKRESKNDKLISTLTGHTNMNTLNNYYQVSDPEKKAAMDQVFNIEIPLKKID
jgi:integrase